MRITKLAGEEKKKEDVPYRLLHSVLETATLLGVSERQVHYMIERDTFQVVKIGRSTKIKRTDIEEFVEKLGA